MGRAQGRRRAAPPRPGRGRWVGGVVAALVVAGYVTLCLLPGDKVPSGTTVAGVEIGGLHAAAAQTRLRQRLEPRFERPERVRGGGVLDTNVVPRTAGVSLDVAGTVRAAGGARSFTPSRIWRSYLGGDHSRSAVLSVRRAPLDRTVTTLAGQLDKPVVEGAVSFAAGHAVPVVAENGRRTDRSAVRRLLERVPDGSVTLPYATLRPTVSAAAVRQAMTSFATPATSGPVQLLLGSHPVTAPPKLFATALSLRPDGGRLVPTLDIDTLLAALEPLMTTVAGAPRPASFVIRGGRPRVVASKIGTSFDRDDLQQKFLGAVVLPAGQRSVSVKGVDAQPSFTTADALALGVRRQVASVTTTFGYADYRNTNIARGVALLDGSIVKPGATLSFDATVGRPTTARGFSTGFELTGGVFKADPGAGLSQLATTLYAAAYTAGLKDAGHVTDAVHNTRLPLGLEVGVDYHRDDLRFIDDTKHGVLVTAASTPSSPSADGSVTVTLWSTRTWEVTVKVGKPRAKVAPKVRHRSGATCSPTVGTEGFSVDVRRVFRRPGSTAVDHRDRQTTVYPPQNAVICSAP